MLFLKKQSFPFRRSPRYQLLIVSLYQTSLMKIGTLHKLLPQSTGGVLFLPLISQRHSLSKQMTYHKSILTLVHHLNQLRLIHYYLCQLMMLHHQNRCLMTLQYHRNQSQMKHSAVVSEFVSLLSNSRTISLTTPSVLKNPISLSRALHQRLLRTIQV